MRLLFFSLILAVSAHATPAYRLQVNVAYGKAPISLTKAEAKFVLAKSVKQIRQELNVRVITRKFRTIKQVNYNFYQTDPVDVYDRIRLDAQRGFYAIEHPTLFLSAPAVSGNTGYIFGATDAYACEHINWKHAGAAIIKAREDVGNEFAQSILAVTHEMGHMLGAFHTFEEFDSVMDANALTLLKENNYQLRFTETSKEQIKQCLRRYFR